MFHNVAYDLGVIQRYALHQCGYELNPYKKGKLKAIYNGQVTEMYVDNQMNPILFGDTMNLMPGSLRSWGEKVGMEKGDYTYFPTEYEEPSEELLKYLKRDVEIIAYWYPELNGEEFFKQGLITQSSIAQNSIKKNLANLQGRERKDGSFKLKFKAPTDPTQKLPIPNSLKIEIKRATDRFNNQEEQIATKDGKRLYGLNKGVFEEYEKLLLRYWNMRFAETYDNYKKIQKAISKKDKNVDTKGFYALELPTGESPTGQDLIDKSHKDAILNSMNKSISSSMRGGISLVNPQWKGFLLENGGSIDVNSLYPFILLEYRIPNTYKGSSKDKYVNPTKYYVAEIKRLRATCKDGKHPFLKRSTRYTKDKEYKREIDWTGKTVKGRCDTVLTSVDINYMYEVYDVHEIEYGTIFYYESDDKWTKAVRKHIEFWKEKKENSKDDTEKQFAKMMLNTVWGRWGMYEKKVKNGATNIDVGDKTTNMVSACFTTALARVYLNKMINEFGEDFVYADTDSVHFLFRKFKDAKALKKKFGKLIDPKIFGAWDLEKEWSEAKYLKSKTYAFKDRKDGKLKVTTAGTRIKIESLDEFYTGAVFPTLKHETDPQTGLIRLYESTFTL